MHNFSFVFVCCLFVHSVLSGGTQQSGAADTKALRKKSRTGVRRWSRFEQESSPAHEGEKAPSSCPDMGSVTRDAPGLRWSQHCPEALKWLRPRVETLNSSVSWLLEKQESKENHHLTIRVAQERSPSRISDPRPELALPEEVERGS